MKSEINYKGKILYGFLLLISDLIFSALSSYLAYYLRFYTRFFGSDKPTYIVNKNYIFYSVIFIAIVVIASLVFRLYFWDGIYKKRNYYLRVAAAPVVSLALTLIYGGLFRKFPFSRLWIFSLFILSILLLFFARLLISAVTGKIFIKKGISTDGLTFGLDEDLSLFKKSQREWSPAGTLEKTSSSERIISIDVLRGFDMLWIMGASELMIALLALSKYKWASRLATEFDHAAWHGFTFYDLIFPLFLFIVGLVIPFSLAKYRNNNIDFKNAYIRIITRTIILFFLGLVANGLLDFDFASMRWSGVLQRIAICYFFTAIIVLHIPARFHLMGIGIILAVILFGYWAIIKFIPVPGFGAGNLTPEGNLAGFLDRMIIPGRLFYKYGDNEGILSTLPAIGTCLLGALTGSMMRLNRTKLFKIKWVFIGGIVSLMLGFAWNFIFPVNKILWTSSFVLFAGGFSLLLFGLFYWLIDYKGYKKWAFPFIVIGTNAITIYFVSYIFDFGIIVNIFVHGFINNMGTAKDAFFYFCLLAVRWLFLYFLYKKKIFFKV
jgi:predicted acyltransferase